MDFNNAPKLAPEIETICVVNEEVILLPITNSAIEELYAGALAGVYDGYNPFQTDWMESLTEKSFFEHHVGNRFDWEARKTTKNFNKATIDFAIVVNNKVVGTQGLTINFSRNGLVMKTGSWITKNEQGKGYGHGAREAILALGKELGFSRSTSRSRKWNKASRKISEDLNYSMWSGPEWIDYTMDLEKYTPSNKIIIAGAGRLRRIIQAAAL